MSVAGNKYNRFKVCFFSLPVCSFRFLSVCVCSCIHSPSCWYLMLLLKRFPLPKLYFVCESVCNTSMNSARCFTINGWLRVQHSVFCCPSLQFAVHTLPITPNFFHIKAVLESVVSVCVCVFVYGCLKSILQLMHIGVNTTCVKSFQWCFTQLLLGKSEGEKKNQSHGRFVVHVRLSV